MKIRTSKPGKITTQFNEIAYDKKEKLWFKYNVNATLSTQKGKTCNVTLNKSNTGLKLSNRLFKVEAVNINKELLPYPKLIEMPIELTESGTFEVTFSFNVVNALTNKKENYLFKVTVATEEKGSKASLQINLNNGKIESNNDKIKIIHNQVIRA